MILQRFLMFFYSNKKTTFAMTQGRKGKTQDKKMNSAYEAGSSANPF